MFYFEILCLRLMLARVGIFFFGIVIIDMHEFLFFLAFSWMHARETFVCPILVLHVLLLLDYIGFACTCYYFLSNF
jgi:hypothetical protein